MEKIIIEHIRNIVDFSIDKKENYFNYSDIKKNLNNNQQIIYIDGGNNEIFLSPSFNLNIVKISAIIFENNNKKKIISHECYLLCEKEKTTIYGKDKNFWIKPNINYDEKNVEIFRRLNELNLAKILSKEYKNSLIVLDGTLKQQFKESNDEKQILKEIYENYDNVFSLVKTNKEYNEKGNSILSIINQESPKNQIWKTNVKKYNDNIKYLYVKLHKRSNFIFKLEFFKENKLNDILNELINNSKDPIFQGYPYGLIIADKIARVSNQESNLSKTYFSTKLNNPKLNLELNASNIHDKIDNINYS